MKRKKRKLDCLMFFSFSSVSGSFTKKWKHERTFFLFFYIAFALDDFLPLKCKSAFI